MVTGQQVLDIACTLIDEISDSGAITLDAPERYQAKTKSILSILQAECSPPSQPTSMVMDLSVGLQVSDKIALSILPYGLAAHLLLSDGDFNTASFFNNRYDELKRKTPTKIQPITNVYSKGVDE